MRESVVAGRDRSNKFVNILFGSSHPATHAEKGRGASKEWPLRESASQPVSQSVSLGSEGAQGIFAPSQSIVLGGRSEYRHV